MADHALDVLEYAQLLEQVGRFAHTEAGREILLSLRPKSTNQAITSRHNAYRDAMRLLETGLRPPALSAPDVGPILQRLAPNGATVEGDDLVLCRDLLDRSASVRQFLMREELAALPCLVELGHRIDPCEQVAAELHRCLDEDGVLLDAASAELRTLRVEGRRLENQIQRRLDQMSRDPMLKDILQESFVTVRNGRFVVPVRRSEKSEIAGVIHDHSNSGQTLFVEPTETLPLGNELADARLKERDECRRILGLLSAGVRERGGAVADNRTVLAEFDALLAVATWATEFRCVLPTFGSDFRLVGARHPLLEYQLKNTGQSVVPLDLAVPQDTSAMVITGSNTGGKTVALKTIGLLSLIAHTGLPVPAAPQSCFVRFRRVFADIGDEQSLAASLSTFSAHMAHITGILNDAQRPGRTLVLLDELGAGTDPLEGGALACSILSQLTQHGALTFATTHLGVIKTFVHEHKRMSNAAMRFNMSTLRPEYSLDIGRPGASHALTIAERLGVPHEVLETARKLMSTDQLRLEGMLAEMEEDQRRLSSKEREVQATVEEITRDKAELHLEMRELRRERRRLLHEAYQQAEGIVRNTRHQMDSLLGELRRQGPGPDTAAGPARQKITVREEKIDRALEQTAPRPEAPLPPGSLAVGQTVWVEKLNSNGRVVEISDRGAKVTVEVGAMRFSMRSKELGKATEDIPEPETQVKVTRPRASAQLSQEISLIGLRVDEALQRLDLYVDRAALAGLPQLRVVHGFGTGRLRRGVHEWLRDCPVVKGFRLGKQGEDPGGAGATLVTLR
ncbi:MAG: endonuclease MutS2 [Lentisphaerae bacterium]|nr:endonuclease MutS2 [Lentisphaerota bacterium]MBT5611602.1 endonuclease MutS2 [Lentisphaerota bacterium]MBT7061701.1 endonuclease MutS2 [Lentisphaerota bacterium]MBT7846547.1 endonuclease MutS2 [Lentisphaerota bacterium]